MRGLVILALLLASAPCHAAETITYSYDALGRVVKVIRNGTVITTYTYDAAGNRTRVLTTGSPNPPPS